MDKSRKPLLPRAYAALASAVTRQATEPVTDETGARLFRVFEDEWWADIRSSAHRAQFQMPKPGAKRPRTRLKWHCLLVLHHRCLKVVFPALASAENTEEIASRLGEAWEELRLFFEGSGFTFAKRTELYNSGRVESLQFTISWKC